MVSAHIYTIIKTTSVGDARLSVVGVAGWVWSRPTGASLLAGRGWHTLPCHPARSRCWAIELHVVTHAHVSMITYRVDVYRSRPIGASLLTTSPQQGCLALNGLHTDWLGVVTGIRW